jgi:hypothetical protein
MGDTLQQALEKLFGAAPPTLEQKPGQPSTPTTPSTPSTDVSALLQQAAAEFTAADNALRAGDLAGYQSHVRTAQSLVEQAANASGGSGGGATTTTTAKPASALGARAVS